MIHTGDNTQWMTVNKIMIHTGDNTHWMTVNKILIHTGDNTHWRTVNKKMPQCKSLPSVWTGITEHRGERPVYDTYLRRVVSICKKTSPWHCVASMNQWFCPDMTERVLL